MVISKHSGRQANRRRGLGLVEYLLIWRTGGLRRTGMVMDI